MPRYTLTAVLGAALAAALLPGGLGDAFDLAAQPARAAQPPDPVPLPLPVPDPVKLKAPKDVPQPAPAEVEALSKTLRKLALEYLPDPLVKSNDGWGRQKEFAEGRVMLRNPNRMPAAPRVLVNDGLWRRITVTARNPNETLGVVVTDLVKADASTALMAVDTVMDIDFRVEHQLWKRGHQLYSGETRGHCKAGLKLKAEVVTKTTPVPGSFLPEVRLSVKATEAKLFYDKVVIDHTAGLDGPDAQAAGEFVLDLVKSIKPDLEQQLLEKANAAIVKAATVKEVKVPLDKLLGAMAPAKK